MEILKQVVKIVRDHFVSLRDSVEVDFEFDLEISSL